MHTLNDAYSSRPVAADAWGPLKAFREAGAKSFESFDIATVRANYVASAKANPLVEDREPDTADYAGGDFRVRVYEPRPRARRSEPTCAVLYMHGGGWLMGNLETHHSLTRRIALLTGLPVVAVDYRLAPEHRYPAAIEDCRAAYRWLSDATAEHGLAVASISVVGDSAGGQLAAALANEFTAVGDGVPLSSQVLLYPITDATRERTETGRSYRRVDAGFPLTAKTMRWFIENFITDDAERTHPDLSPLLADLPDGLPPTLVLTMDNDPLADEGGEYAARLAQAGCPVTYRHLVGYHHGLFTQAALIERGRTELAAVAAFIKEHAS